MYDYRTNTTLLYCAQYGIELSSSSRSCTVACAMSTGVCSTLLKNRIEWNFPPLSCRTRAFEMERGLYNGYSPFGVSDGISMIRLRHVGNVVAWTTLLRCQVNWVNICWIIIYFFGSIFDLGYVFCFSFQYIQKKIRFKSNWFESKSILISSSESIRPH